MPTFRIATTIIGLLLSALLVTACGSDSGPEATRIPPTIEPTPTARSTALPDVEPAAALGDETRPIVVQISLFGESTNSAARRVAIDLQDELRDALDLTVNVEFVDEVTALTNLCSGRPTAAWTSPFTYAAAAAQCDVAPLVAVQHGRMPNASIGTTAEFITTSTITELSALAGQTFCRSDEHDLFTTWGYPSLLLRAQNVNPITDLGARLDYPDDLSLLFALYEGTCDAAALPPNIVDDLLVDIALLASTEEDPVTVSEVEDALHVLIDAGDTAAPARDDNAPLVFDAHVVPHDVFIAPPTTALPLDIRAALIDAMVDFFDDRANGSERLDDLLDATGLIEVDAESYANFRALIEASEWNMVYDG